MVAVMIVAGEQLSGVRKVTSGAIQFHFCLLPVGSGPGIYSAVEQESSKTINFLLGEVLQINNPFVLRGNSNIWMVCTYVCEYNGDFEAEPLLCVLFNSY